LRVSLCLAFFTLTGGSATAAVDPNIVTATTTSISPVSTVSTISTISTMSSKAIGRPTRGRLADAVQFPESGTSFLTWDSSLQRVGNQAWRRWATSETVRRTICVLDEYAKANPGSPRVLVGDLSLQTGGPFGVEYGGPGHASHQNGLDVDVYYPRVDRIETVVTNRKDADFIRSQELVDRFVDAGASHVFVGRRTPLRGLAPTVQRLSRHENHLHVRFENADQPHATTTASAPATAATTSTVLNRPAYPSCL
jgi:murein endopeptidase